MQIGKIIFLFIKLERISFKFGCDAEVDRAQAVVVIDMAHSKAGNPAFLGSNLASRFRGLIEFHVVSSGNITLIKATDKFS